MREPPQPLERRIAVDDGVTLVALEYRPPAGALRLPVLFLPGWVSHRSVWGGLIGRLALSAHVFHIEGRDKDSAEFPVRPQRGGGSRDPDMSLQRQAADLGCVVRELGLGPQSFHLVGSSTGSNVIIDYLASPRARQPASAALMLPVGRFPIPAWARPLLLLPHHVITALKPAIKAYIRLRLSDRYGERAMLAYNFASIDRIEPWRTRLAARALLSYSLPAELSRIRVPALVAAAGADRMHSRDVAARIAAAIAGGELVDVGESGRVHSPWMAGLLLDFLARSELSERSARSELSGSGSP